MRVGRVARSIGVIAGIGCLSPWMTACTSTAEAEPVPIPSVRFEPSERPDTLLDDPWVQIVERAEVARAAAHNAANYADPGLTERWGPSMVDLFVRKSRGGLLRGWHNVRLGPTSFRAFVVREGDDGQSAEVAGCTLGPLLAGEEPSEEAVPMTYWLETFEDGHRRIVDVGQTTRPVALDDGEILDQEFCTRADIARAVFVPQPDPSVLDDKEDDDLVLPSASAWPLPSESESERSASP